MLKCFWGATGVQEDDKYSVYYYYYYYIKI